MGSLHTIRASGGIFYNFINRSQYLYNGGPLVSQVRSVLNSTLDELDDYLESHGLPGRGAA